MFTCGKCYKITFGHKHGSKEGFICSECYQKLHNIDLQRKIETFMFDFNFDDIEKVMQIMEGLENIGLIKNLREFDGIEYGI